MLAGVIASEALGPAAWAVPEAAKSATPAASSPQIDTRSRPLRDGRLLARPVRMPAWAVPLMPVWFMARVPLLLIEHSSYAVSFRDKQVNGYGSLAEVLPQPRARLKLGEDIATAATSPPRPAPRSP